MIDLVERFKLQSERSAESGPGGSIESLLEQLEPQSARYLRLCAIPHQFDPDILRVLAPELNPGQVETYCEEFSSLPVITFNQDGMAFHDKARHYLFQHWLDPPVSKDFVGASGRLAAYFAKRYEVSQGEQQKNYTIRRVFHLVGASQQTGFDEFQQLCRQMRHQFRLNDCEHLIKLVHEYDKILSPEREMWLTYHEGKLAADRCQWELAEELIKRIINGAAPPDLSVLAYNRLGMIFDERREFSKAIAYYKKALKIATTLPNARRYKYRILHGLGTAYRDIGNLEEAENLLKKSIDLAAEMNNQSGLAMGYNSLGTLYNLRRKTSEAIELYEKSLENLNKTGDSFRTAQVYNNLGLVYAERTDWRKSCAFFERSLDITRQSGDALGQAKTLNNLTRIYQNLGLKEQAIETAQRAIRLFEEMREYYSSALTKRDLGRLYHRMNNHGQAHQALTGAIKTFNQCGETAEANRTQVELNRLRHKTPLPWLLIIFVTILFALFLLILHHMFFGD